MQSWNNAAAREHEPDCVELANYGLHRRSIYKWLLYQKDSSMSFDQKDQRSEFLPLKQVKQMFSENISVLSIVVAETTKSSATNK